MIEAINFSNCLPNEYQKIFVFDGKRFIQVEWKYNFYFGDIKRKPHLKWMSVLDMQKIFKTKYHKKTIDFIAMEEDRLAWSLKTFINQSKFGSLRHAESEIKEIEADPTIPSEYADAIMCILDCAGRHGITVEKVLEAYKKKIEINKGRKWKLLPEGHYQHINED